MPVRTPPLEGAGIHHNPSPGPAGEKQVYGEAVPPPRQGGRLGGVSRLRKDAQLWDLPPAERRPGQRGPMPSYGKWRISLAKRAGQTRGWRQVEYVQWR